jgi:membrane protease subunit HflK
VDLVGVTPPPQVAPAFDDVVQAEQERSGKISEARAYAARRANETEGEAARRLSEARAAADRLVAETGADADYFRAVRARYVEAPDVTARTLRQETLRRVLSAVRQKYFLRRNASGEQELRLWLSPERPPLALPAAPGTP